MRFPAPTLLFFCLLASAVPASAQTPPPDVQQAQAQVWNLEDRLLDARYQLALVRMNAEKARLQTGIQAAENTHNLQKSLDLQKRLADLEHKRMVENQKLKLNHQLIQAERVDDRAAMDSIRAQLRDLR